MKKRLAWNFEINIEAHFNLPMVTEELNKDSHWEFRFFWSESDIVSLSGLDEQFLELSRYKIKHRSDTYSLLPNADYNIKTRRGELVYKPLIERTKYANAYGKKIKLEDDSTTVLDINGEQTPLHSLLKNPTNQGRLVLVNKEALIYKFESHPSAKLELARLSIDEKIYFSVGIESHARSLVEDLTQRIIGNRETTDYVAFLKQCRRG